MIFFDIDGTIVEDGTHFCPPSTVNAIRKARENGHLTFINTGRPFFNVTQPIRDIGFDGYVCGCGTYINCSDSVLLAQSIPHETCVDIVKNIRKYKMEALFEYTDYVIFDQSKPPAGFIAEMKERFGACGIDITRSWDDPDLVFDKFVTWWGEDSDFAAFHSYIIREFDYIDRGNKFGEVVPKGFSKATGIQFLQEYFNVPLENCYAVGDSTNDLPMLDYVPNSIAMGNSMPELFDKVAFVTKAIDDNGIEHALAHFGII